MNCKYRIAANIYMYIYIYINMVCFRCITGNNLHKSDDDVNNNNNIKMDLQKVGWGTWTGSIWLGIGTCHGHL